MLACACDDDLFCEHGKRTVANDLAYREAFHHSCDVAKRLDDAFQKSDRFACYYTNPVTKWGVGQQSLALGDVLEEIEEYWLDEAELAEIS